MSAVLTIAILAAGIFFHGTAYAAEERLVDLDALHAACRTARSGARPVLYHTTLSEVRFQNYDRDAGSLLVDTSRNFRLFGGSAELFPTGLESIGFIATPERARALRRRARRLRVGFFLSFDGGQACLIRPAAAVTTVRIDIAYVELLDVEGGVLAREDSERLRAWMDDDVPEPGLTVSRGTVVSGAPQVLSGLRARLPRTQGCFENAGGDAATVVLRLRVVEGRISRVETELSTLRDRSALTCVRRCVQEAAANGSGEMTVTYRYTPASR